MSGVQRHIIGNVFIQRLQTYFINVTLMGARRNGQEKGALAPPLRKVVKCFGALVMTVDDIFIHYFQNIRRFLGASPTGPDRRSIMDPAGERKPQTPNLPTLEKIPRAPMVKLINILFLFERFYIYALVTTKIRPA